MEVRKYSNTQQNDFGVLTDSCIFSNNFYIYSYFCKSVNYILHISSFVLLVKYVLLVQELQP